jgi:hypothetical protein
MSPHDIEAALAGFDRIGADTAKRVIDYYVTRYNSGGDSAKPGIASTAAITAVA